MRRVSRSGRSPGGWDGPRPPSRRTCTTRLMLTKDLRIAHRSDSSGRLLVMHGRRSASGSSALAATARSRRSRLPDLSDIGSATAGGAATALVLATSRRVASTGRFELGGGPIVGEMRAIRANQGRCWPRWITDALPKQVRVSHLGDAFLGDKRGLPGQIAVMTSNSASSVPTLATALGGRPARQALCIGVMQARRAVGELHEHATASSDDRCVFW